MNLNDLLDSLDREAEQTGDTARLRLVAQVRANPPSARAFPARLAEAMKARDASKVPRRIGFPGFSEEFFDSLADAPEQARRRAERALRVAEAEDRIDAVLRDGVARKPERAIGADDENAKPNLKPAHRLALESWWEAVQRSEDEGEQLPNSGATPEHWKYLKDNGSRTYEEAEKPLPNKATWGRYVREALRETQGPANTRRTGPTGGSIVRQRDT